MFNPEFKAIGDAEFIMRLLDNGYKSLYVNEYFSTFVKSGNNFSQTNLSKLERQKIDTEKGIITNKLQRIFFDISIIFLKILSGFITKNSHCLTKYIQKKTNLVKSLSLSQVIIKQNGK